jgi:tetratricopeptide (TPR) repeat protein
MRAARTILVALLFVLPTNAAFAEDLSLFPKYGLQPKNEAERASDQKFLASVDGLYKGNRKKAAEDVATKGWQLLREGNLSDAMRRFNQAWLLDNANGNALWGMAAIQSSNGELAQSLKLFSEAERTVGGNVDFSVDYAKALGTAGAQRKDDALLRDAFARFAHVYKGSPNNVLNLQNWAITLFYVGNYAEAWKKVKVAEAAPGHASLDSKFVAALQAKMPRP